MDVKSELKDAQLEIVDGEKTYNVNKLGLTWFDRTADKIKTFFNGLTETIATESWVEEQIGASETSLGDGGLVTAEQETITTPDEGYKTIAAKSDGIYYMDSEEEEVRLVDTGLFGVNKISIVEGTINVTNTDNNGILVGSYTATQDCLLLVSKLSIPSFAGDLSSLYISVFDIARLAIRRSGDSDYKDGIFGGAIYLKSGDRLGIFASTVSYNQSGTQIAASAYDLSYQYTIIPLTLSE